MNGGWLGFGYGASEGKTEFSLTSTLISNHYGREKGNSQLAILEETGIIGFILYLIVVLLLTLKLFILFVRSKDPEIRALIGLLAGAFFGMILHSSFEAWWNSPGSPESIYFWTLVGIIKGLEILNSKDLSNNYATFRIKT